MREVTVATVQMKPKLGEIESNLEQMSDLIGKIAGQQKVDLIVFPELITTGYECGVRFTDLAQRVPGVAVNVMAQRAQEFGVHIAFGLPRAGAAKLAILDLQGRHVRTLAETALPAGPAGSKPSSAAPRAEARC